MNDLQPDNVTQYIDGVFENRAMFYDSATVTKSEEQIVG